MALNIQDDRSRDLTFTRAPQRVISLVPSDTLNVAELGCGAALVGRTDYCELPVERIAQIPSVGGTKNPRVAEILDLAPDLVIANQEENSRGDLEALLKAGIRVYIAFPKRVATGLSHLAKLARIFHVERDGAARQLLQEGYHALREAEEARKNLIPLRTFCPIWADPLMTIHGDTFISDMLDLVGAQNIFADRERRYPLAADLGTKAPLPEDKTVGRDKRYPRVSDREVSERDPELVVLPSEPHPFSEADAARFAALPLCANTTQSIHFIDGKDLSWYGARSVQGLARLRAQIAGLRARMA